MPKKKIKVRGYTRRRNGKIEHVKTHDRNIKYNLGNTPDTNKHKSDYVEFIGEDVYDELHSDDDVKVNTPYGVYELKNIKFQSTWLSDKFEDEGVLQDAIERTGKKWEYFGEVYKNGVPTGEYAEIWANTREEMIKEFKENHTWQNEPMED